MDVIIQPNPEAAARMAARVMADLIRNKPDTVLGLATGSTPLGLYRELIRLHREEGLDFSRVTTFNLDEYVGLGPDHPASYHTFMFKHLFHALNIPREHIHIPDGLAKDIPAHCASYEDAIRDAGGIDMQVLGIGANGHIGFNEPMSSFTSHTTMTTLASRTRQDNAPFFEREEMMPHHAITMGIGTIMESRQCLMLAFGRRKARPVAQMIEGSVTPLVPASVLQQHPAVRVFLDKEAASELRGAGYDRRLYENKPEWQKT